jgi:hypothetical protein
LPEPPHLRGRFTHPGKWPCSGPCWYAYNQDPPRTADRCNTSGTASQQDAIQVPDCLLTGLAKSAKSSPTHRNHGALALTGLSIGWVTQEACRQRETEAQISKPKPAKQARESQFYGNKSIDTHIGQFAAVPAQDPVFS